MRKTRYEARGFLKHAEEDSFEHGCDPNSSTMFADDHIRFNAEKLEDLIEELQEFCISESPQDVLIDSCEEPGRVDIQVYENANGHPVSESEMEEWKKGLFRIWLCTYTFRVELVIREEVAITPLLPNTKYITES